MKEQAGKLLRDLRAIDLSRLVQWTKEKDLFSLLQAHLAGGLIEQGEMIKLISDCEAIPIDHPTDFLDRSRSFLSLLFLAKLSNQLSLPLISAALSLFHHLERVSYWESFQLGASLLDVAASLLSKQRKQRERKLLPTGGVLKEACHYAFDGAIFNPLISAQLALVWLYLGSVNRDEKQLEDGLKAAYFLLELFDSQGRLFHGLWNRESQFQLANLWASCQLLFFVAASFSSEEVFAAHAEALADQLAELSDEQLSEIDPFIAILEVVFQQINSPMKSEMTLSRQNIDRASGLLRYDHGALSLACTASGVNTGLGVLHKGKIQIVSFGPHFYPLADSERYGFYRTCREDREGFEDIAIECELNRCRFEGWSRLVLPDPMVKLSSNFSSACPGDQWILFDLTAEEERVDLKISSPHSKEEHPLAFVFFIKAEQILIEGERPLLPGMIDQFKGKSAILRARLNGEELRIIPRENKGTMQVIPLAGKNHFWGADFLLAYAIDRENNRLAWTIS